MRQQDIKALLKKISSGKFTPEEERIATYWLLKLNQEGQSDLTDDELEIISQEMWVSLEALPSIQPRRSRILWPRIAAAASIILAVSVGGYILIHKTKPEQQFITNKQSDVKPGGNKAFLVLGNGQRISLTDSKNGTIASQAGKAIQKTRDGTLVYDNSHNNHSTAEIVFNTVETPRGGQYQIVLPDGSKVWLNAASSLRYPAEFTGNDRSVELKGEGYFEVAKDKAHPFRVKTGQQTVEVLGTHFDINSYADEAKTATTLLEGSVKVTTATNEVVIKPGQQALNAAGNLKVDEANIDNVIDWKNGDFYLNRVDFRVAMRKISRWYDVEVIYDPALPDDIESGGWISRDKPLSAVLHAMEHTGQVRFKVENNKIYVTKGTSTPTK